MANQFLLTSFDTWLPHQYSNSSDDLLLVLATLDLLPDNCATIHRLPVVTTAAFAQVLAAIDRHNPDIIICCGMAESRQVLSVEKFARKGDRTLQTTLDLSTLIKTLPFKITEMSEDAGDFVCNAIYYQLLEFINSKNCDDRLPRYHGLFVHVPPLIDATKDLIVQDFHVLIDKLSDDGINQGL